MVEVEVLKGEKRDGESRESKKKKKRRRKKDLERDLVKSEKRIPPRIQGDLLAYPRGNVLWAKIQGSRRFLNSFRKPGQIYFAYEYDFIPLPSYPSTFLLSLLTCFQFVRPTFYYFSVSFKTIKTKRMTSMRNFLNNRRSESEINFRKQSNSFKLASEKFNSARNEGEIFNTIKNTRRCCNFYRKRKL